MNRKVLKQRALPLLFRYFQNNNNESRNIQKVLSAWNQEPVDRITATHVYKLFSSRPYQANMGTILRTFESYLQKSLVKNREKDKNVAATRQFQSLFYLISKIEAFLKYSIPCQNQLKMLEEILLFNELAPSEMIMILSLLKEDVYQNDTFQKIREIIAGLPFSPINNSIYPSEMTIIRKHTSEIIESKCSQLLNDSFSVFDKRSISSLPFSHSKIQELRRRAMLESSLIKKRIIYLLLLHETAKSNVQTLNLPGKICETEQEYEEALIFMKKLGPMTPFINIFDLSFKNNRFMKQNSPNQCLLELMVNYYFDFLSKGYFKLKKQNVQIFLDLFRSLDKVQLKKLCEKMKTEQLLKGLFLLSYCKKFKNQTDETLLDTMTEVIAEIIDLEKIRNIPAGSFGKEYLSLKIMNNFIIEQIICIVKASTQSKQFKNCLKMEVIRELIEFHIKKWPFPHLYSEISQIFNYSKALISSSSLQSPSILYSESVTKAQLDIFLDIFLDNRSINIINTSNLLKKIGRHFQLIKNCVLQPNIKISYLLLKKQTRVVICAFDLKKEVGRSSLFEGDITERGVVEETDLNGFGYWKYGFFKDIYQVQYKYCRSKEEIGLKLCSSMEVETLM